MKTFADIKRRFKVGGIIECVENTYVPALNGRRRVIDRVQGNAIRWHHIDGGDERASWTPFPKAAAVRVIDADTFSFSLELRDAHRVVLRFVEESAP